MEDSPVKPSVAELAGRFKNHALPTPAGNEERKPVRRKPPASLQLRNLHGESEPEKPTVISPHPPKVKLKNSPLIEKLQANLALSPTGHLPSPKSPELKLQPTPFSPVSGPLSPTLRPPSQHSEDEVPVSFEQPAEGTPLPSINKSRARLSFKRRPPTRQHRKSASEDAGFESGGESKSPTELENPQQNGNGEEVFKEVTEESDGTQQNPSQQPSAAPETEEQDGKSSEVKDTTQKGPSQDTEGKDDIPAEEQGVRVETSGEQVVPGSIEDHQGEEPPEPKTVGPSEGQTPQESPVTEEEDSSEKDKDTGE
ncbi:capZ-interacting protein [Chanos chanos]|uniref:CapZ-interacting protein n=1 Tax=Chanos chanos TaxID=29144 RepID=A0A6J2VJY7_CHACN|nr:capZ-interacting protein [Chanos chanos]